MFLGSCYYVVILFFQFPDLNEVAISEGLDPGIDPGIEVNFADATSIDNCLALASVTTEATPDNGVPDLTRGKKKVIVEVNSLLVVDLLL